MVQIVTAQKRQYQRKNGAIFDRIKIPRGPWASRFCAPLKFDSRSFAA
jgi:hypothetical protein